MTSRTLLYVDDNESLVSFSAMNLQEAIPELDVRIAHDCAEARALAAKHQLEVLVTDQRLPDGNGLDLRRELVAAQPDLQCILVCATPPLRAEGFLGIIRKPFGGEDLVQAVRKALDQRESATPPVVPIGEDPTEDDNGFDRHRVLNRLSSLLAKLRAFDMDLRDGAESPEMVRHLADEYIERLVATVHELAEMIRRH